MTTTKLILVALLLNLAQTPPSPRNTVRGLTAVDNASKECHRRIEAAYNRLVLTEFQEEYSKAEREFMDIYRAHEKAFGTPENIPVLDNTNTAILANWKAKWKLPPTSAPFQPTTPRARTRDVSPAPNMGAGSAAASSSAPVAPLRVNLPRRSRTSVEEGQAPTTPVVTPRSTTPIVPPQNVTSPQSEGAPRAVNFQNVTPTLTPRQTSAARLESPAFGREEGSPGGRSSHSAGSLAVPRDETSPGGRSSRSSRSATSQIPESDLSPQNVPEPTPIFSFTRLDQPPSTPNPLRERRPDQEYQNKMQARDAENILRLKRIVLNPHARINGKTCYIAKIKGNPPITIRIDVDGYREGVKCVQELNTFEEPVYFTLKQNLGSDFGFYLTTNLIPVNFRSNYLVKTMSIMPDFADKLWSIAQDNLPNYQDQPTNLYIIFKNCKKVFEYDSPSLNEYDIKLLRQFLVFPDVGPDYSDRLEISLICEGVQLIPSLTDPLGTTISECVLELICAAKEIESTMKLNPELRIFRPEILDPLTRKWSENLHRFGKVGIYMSRPNEL